MNAGEIARSGAHRRAAIDTDTRLPAEWEEQSGVMLTWPHARSDWAPLLDEVVPCFVAIAREIARRERCLIVCQDEGLTRSQLGALAQDDNLRLVVIDSNDTWARDHGPLTVFAGGVPHLLDFTFNGWGLKFPANLDNLITRRLYERGDIFQPGTRLRNLLHLTLEGGSIESDGHGTLLTTETCLLSPNRNAHYDREELVEHLKQSLGVERVLWLRHGHLEGDDTDSHIDTLARFCDRHTIAFVRCDDPYDPHHETLSMMAEELQALRTAVGAPYRLIALPMAEPVNYEGHRLPATYANFLILNQAVLVPTYGTDTDAEALELLRQGFPGREVVGIDCRALIKQHGSLHCVTMQFPVGVLA